MDGSRTIRVIKRDGDAEPFDRRKLAAAMHAAMREAGRGRFRDAEQLALAIEIYLNRVGRTEIPSRAIFEMSVRVLRRVRLFAPASAMEANRLCRARRRARLRVVHGCGKVTLWEKAWLAELACRSWGLGRQTGRIIAGEVERVLLGGQRAEVRRDEIQARINEAVAACGLAEAVPVRASR